MNPSFSLSPSPCPCFLDNLGEALPLRIVLVSTLGSLSSSKAVSIGLAYLSIVYSYLIAVSSFSLDRSLALRIGVGMAPFEARLLVVFTLLFATLNPGYFAIRCSTLARVRLSHLSYLHNFMIW